MMPAFLDKLFINGEWIEAKTKEPVAIINPFNEDILVEISYANAHDIDLAVLAAHRAFATWSRLEPCVRQNYLWRLAQLISENTEEMARIETLNTGKTLFDSSKIEIPLVAEIFRYFAGFATKIHGNTLPATSSSLKLTIQEPIGVCGLIVPWNFPLLMAAWKIAPALAAGNTVVLKPAEQTPLSALKLAELVQKAGIPPGVFNVVPGFGKEAGEALVKHPLVQKISFTGSTQTGKTVMRQAADTLKRITLELGGKSPNIIFADADLKSALRGAMSGIFYNKGEVCAAGSRLLVEDSIYEDVVEQLRLATEKYVLGDPLDKATRMGPLISRQQQQRVLKYVDIGLQEGATLVCGGNTAEKINDGRGFFVRPTIFKNVDNNMTIAKEEIFGPVLSVIPFKDPADALMKANQSAYDLAAGIWTKNIQRALRIAQEVKAGTVWINAYNLYDPALPFGGFQDSGFGRDLGASAIAQYTETKALWIDVS